MLVRCNPKCKINDGMTECKLDESTNKAICMECGDEILSVSSFAKTSMKLNKDVIRKDSRAAFVFKCETHDKMVKVVYNNHRLQGLECKGEEGDCLINITDNMKSAIMQYGDENGEIEFTEEDMRE